MSFMLKAIDFHTNILEETSSFENPRLQELISKIKPNTAKKVKIIQKKTIQVNKNANFKSLINSMKKNNISNSVCFSYQWKKHNDCLRSNNYIISTIKKYNFTNLLCLVVVQPKSKNAKYDLQNYLEDQKVLGLKIKPSWCDVNLSDIKNLGPLCEELIHKKKILLTHITQGFHPNKGDNIYELSMLLRNFPKLKVVAAHMGGGISFYENYKPLQKLFKNLYIDISLPSQLNWLPSYFKNINHKKFLFATDYPYFNQNNMLLNITKLKIPKNKVKDLLYFNAKNLINSCNINLNT